MSKLSGAPVNTFNLQELRIQLRKARTEIKRLEKRIQYLETEKIRALESGIPSPL